MKTLAEPQLKILAYYFNKAVLSGDYKTSFHEVTRMLAPDPMFKIENPQQTSMGIQSIVAAKLMIANRCK